MTIKSLILATILAILGSLAINTRSAYAQIRRPIGRAYFLPASPSIISNFIEDTNGDLIPDLEITPRPQPIFEFSVLTELDGQPITDQDPDSSLGFFPDAIPSFLYVEDTKETRTRLTDDNGNLLPSIQEPEIIEQIIPGIPTTFSNGSLFTRRETTSDGITEVILYDFVFFEEEEFEFISFFLILESISEDPIIDPVLATNDISYIIDQNLFGQENLVNKLRFADASFNIDAFFFKANEIESSAILVAESVSEPNNVIGLLILGTIGTKLLTKYKIKRD